MRSLWQRVKEQLSGESLTLLETPLSVITEQAGKIAKEIETFRGLRNIKSDLIGSDLIDAIAISIIRVKIYYWISYYVYHSFVASQEDIPSVVLWGKLLNPNITELAQLESFFSSIPQEYFDIIFSKHDKLTELMKAAEGAQKKLDKLNEPIKKTKSKTTKENVLTPFLSVLLK